MICSELRELLNEAGPDYRVIVEVDDVDTQGTSQDMQISDVRVDHSAKLVVLETEFA